MVNQRSMRQSHRPVVSVVFRKTSFSLNPCCRSYTMLGLLRCFVRFEVTICAINFQQMHVSEIGR